MYLKGHSLGLIMIPKGQKKKKKQNPIPDMRKLIFGCSELFK